MPLPPVVLTVYVVTGIIFVFCASWLNDSCAVPLTFSSLLFVLSLSLSPLFLLCLFLFRTNLHACLLIISLACLHDVESQAKLLAHIIPPLSVMSL